MSGIATAIIGGAVVGGVAQNMAADKAAEATGEATDKSIEFQERALETLREDLAPYTQLGVDVIPEIRALVGIGDEEAAASAIERIEAGPEFQERVRLGEEAILQSAAATGGLRGGDVQRSLAQFRPQVLSDMMNQRFSQLGGLAQLGQASAAGAGATGVQVGQNIGQQLIQQGRLAGQAKLAGGQAIGDIAGSFGVVAGLSDPSKGFGRF